MQDSFAPAQAGSYTAPTMYVDFSLRVVVYIRVTRGVDGRGDGRLFVDYTDSSRPVTVFWQRGQRLVRCCLSFAC